MSDTQTSPAKEVRRQLHSAFTEEFLHYIERRELRYPRCKKTGTVLGYTARQCTGDPSDAIEWVKAEGSAVLYSFVVYHQTYTPDFPTPYNVALVELKEGPRLISTIIVDDFGKLKAGMKLKASFENSGRLVFLPV